MAKLQFAMELVIDLFALIHLLYLCSVRICIIIFNQISNYSLAISSFFFFLLLSLVKKSALSAVTFCFCYCHLLHFSVMKMTQPCPSLSMFKIFLFGCLVFFFFLALLIAMKAVSSLD